MAKKPVSKSGSKMERKDHSTEGKAIKMLVKDHAKEGKAMKKKGC